MDLYRELGALPSLSGAVVTVGTFDGFHRGHQAVIKALTATAKENQTQSVVVTFERHPKQLLSSRDNAVRPEIILSIEDKLDQLERAKVDIAVVLDFDEELSRVSAGEFLQKYIVEPFHPSAIIVGYDNKFGFNREGDIAFLEQHQSQFDYTVKEMPEVNSPAEKRVSSSRVRELVRDGRCEEAAEILGRPYAFSAKIVAGDGRGSDLGYPTANLELLEVDQLIPAIGVYVVSAQMDGKQHYGMTNVGVRPTFGAGPLVIEVHLFDFEHRELYGEQIKVAVHHRLRDEKKFDNIEALVTQLAVDRSQSLKWIEENKKGEADYALNN